MFSGSCQITFKVVVDSSSSRTSFADTTVGAPGAAGGSSTS